MKRILIIFPWPNEKGLLRHPEQVISGGCWSYVQALRSLGHVVDTINLYNASNHWDLQQACDDLSAMSSAGYDYAIVFEFGNLPLPYAEIARNIPFFYHAGDDPMRYEGNLKCIQEGGFKGVLCAQKPSIIKYEADTDLPAAWIPYHFDSYLHYPEKIHKIADFMFIGKVYGDRATYLKSLADNGINLKQEFGFFGSAYRKKSCQGRLGWHNAWCGEVGYRHFEIPAMGLMMMCDKLDVEYGLDQLYPEGTIVLYESPEDCLEKMRYYLDHDSEREAIAQNGMAWCRQHHGSLRRAQQITEVIERWI